jgi:hypothetical protein
VHGIFDSDSSWPPGIACAGVVVIFLSDGVGRCRHASSLPSPLCPIKVEALSSDRVVLSRPSTDIWPPPTSPTVSICTSLAAYSRPHARCGLPPVGDLSCFLHPLWWHSAPHTPWSSSRLHSRFFPSSMAFASKGVARLSLFRMSTLQDSLYGTDCHLAPLSQRHTPAFTLPVTRSMRSSLRGSLAITATGLSPAS